MKTGGKGPGSKGAGGKGTGGQGTGNAPRGGKPPSAGAPRGKRPSHDARRRAAARPAGSEERVQRPVRPRPVEEAPKPTRAQVKAETAQVLSTGVQQLVVTPDENEMRIDRFLEARFPQLSFSHIQRIVRKGELRVDGKRAAPGDRIEAGQVLRVPPAEAPKPAAAPARRQRAPLSEDQIDFAQALVIHRDRQAIVVNKPPGLATQGGTKTEMHLDGLLDALQFEAEGRPKLVHRLDKDTSGALLLARSARAAAHFAKAFSSRTARKVYWALVIGVPSIDDGMIELPLAKQPGTGGEKMHVDEKEGLPSRTRYRVIERAGNRAAWVELQPFTGRTHQLRVHMAAIGHPIVGDGKYGGKEAFLSGGISRKMHLHARRIRVDHPDGGHVDVSADLPSHFAESVATLGFDTLLAEALPFDEVKFSETTEGKRRKAAAVAKDKRRERKGERRGRSRTGEKRG